MSRNGSRVILFGAAALPAAFCLMLSALTLGVVVADRVQAQETAVAETEISRPTPIERRPLITPQEREQLQRTLEKTEGNRTRAAELLGLSTRALRYKIKQYGL